MQKIVIIGVAFLLGIIAIVYFIPFSRSYHHQLVIQANPALVYRKILQNAEWQNWYTQIGFTKNSPSKISPVKSDEMLAYQISENEREITGKVKLNISLEGGTYLDWNETVQLNDGMKEKFQLLFQPASYATALRRSLGQLKEDLEQPAEEEAGVRFKVYQMKGHVIAALLDTVLSSEINDKLVELYTAIRAAFPAGAFQDASRFMSRSEAIDENRIQLQVGLRMNDPLVSIAAPMKRLEVPSVLVAVVSASVPYERSSELEQIAHGWVSKHNLKLATSFWYEHGMNAQNKPFQLKDTLRIVQPFYYWPHPVPDIY